MDDLGPIILPPTPKPGRTYQESQLRIDEWTRACEQAVRKMEKYVRALKAAIVKAGVPI